MSTPSRIKRITAPELAARKGGEPIAVLTAYTAPMAQFLDEHVDCLLVGDSLGMVVYGFDTTLAVTLDMMINHGAAVLRHCRYAVRLLSGIAGAGLSECRPHHAGNRL
jgi:3-methyl-2-oxobutanoate hydroxymethyltransferase